MLDKSTIAANLKAIGVKDKALVNFIYREANSSQTKDPQDFLQEAVIAHLSGADVRKWLWRFAKEGHQEISVEALQEHAEADSDADLMEVLERQSFDNERPDWIPTDPEGRESLYQDCQKALQRVAEHRRPYRARAGYDKFVYYASITILGRKQFLGYFDTDEKRKETELATLRRIMGWVETSDASQESSQMFNPMAPNCAEMLVEMIAKLEERLGVPAVFWRRDVSTGTPSLRRGKLIRRQFHRKNGEWGQATAVGMALCRIAFARP